jgi:hypothetical protein
MAIKVGTLQVDLIANTASFTGPLDKAGQQARRSAKDIQDGFNKMDLGEARGTLMVTGELIGVHIPRHVQALIATLPVLGPALAAAFPVIAILAVVDAVVKFIEKSDEAKHKLDEHRSAAVEASSAFARHSEELEINNLKLKDRLAVLNLQPAQNGTAIAAFEAKNKIDQLEDSLKKALLTQQELFKSQIDSSFMSFIGKGTGEVSEMASHFHQGLDQMKEYYDDWHRYENMGDTANADKFKKLYEQKKQAIHDFAADSIKTLKDTQSAPAPVLPLRAPGQDSAQLAAITESYERQNAAAAALLPTVETLYGTFLQGEKQVTAGTTADELQKGIARAESMQQAIAQLDKKYAAEKQVTAEQTKAALAAYQIEFDQGKITAEQLAELKQSALDREYQAELAHLEKVRTLEAGRAALVKQTNQQIAALNDSHEAQVLTDYAAALNKRLGLLKELDRIIGDENRKSSDDEVALALKTVSEKDKIFLAWNNARLDKEKQHTDALGAIEEQGLQFKREMGLISEADYEAELQTELNATYMVARKELEAKRDATVAGTAARVQADAQLQALEDKYRKDSERNEQQSLLRRANNIRQLSSTITSQFDGWIRGTETFSQTWNKLWTGMATTAIESLVQVGIQELIGLAIHQTIADKKKLTDAKSAFHGAYAATSDIPIIGPVLAPVAGAAAFAAVMAFEKGGIVPQDAYALVHHNEMVLPAPISSFIVNAASSATGSGSGGDHHHFVFAPTVQAVDAEGVDRMLTKHADTFHRHLRAHVRRMNYA